MIRLVTTFFVVLLSAISLLAPETVAADAVAVRHTEGLLHGFLVLRTLDGDTLAEGDLLQFARAGQVTTRLVFRFKDGSIHDETAEYSQRGKFQLLHYHLVQKGPSFKHPIEVKIDVPTGQVTITSTDDKGIEKTTEDHLDLPPDLANGLLTTLLQNIPAEATQTKVSFLAATPKPRLIKLAITSQGKETFSVSGSVRTANHYVVKVEIGGAAGLLAPLVGKQPADIHIWILGEAVPAFVKMEGPLYFGGPIWRIELACPIWPKPAKGNSRNEPAQD
jgi:hypothetical protein